ncbi:MAG: NUDIX hydrolase [Methylocystaceae bacterium]|nr:NUDIX hydrolase [Methylocystaceae bacterium]
MKSRSDIIQVDRLECRISNYDWAFEKDRAQDILGHWRACTQRNPSLYDGRILLAQRIEADLSDAERVLRVDFFETSFSAFMAWRDFGWPDKTIFNCFSQAAVCAREGAFLLGEMGSDHSNAGAFYFPCGNPDLSDVRPSGAVDLRESLIRELREETGLEAREGQEARDWIIVFDGQRAACIRRFDWPVAHTALKKRVDAFLAAQSQPELSGVVFLKDPAALEQISLPPFMKIYLHSAFRSAAGMNFRSVQYKLPSVT